HVAHIIAVGAARAAAVDGVRDRSALAPGRAAVEAQRLAGGCFAVLTLVRVRVALLAHRAGAAVDALVTAVLDDAALPALAHGRRLLQVRAAGQDRAAGVRAQIADLACVGARATLISETKATIVHRSAQAGTAEHLGHAGREIVTLVGVRRGVVDR